MQGISSMKIQPVNDKRSRRTLLVTIVVWSCMQNERAEEEYNKSPRNFYVTGFS